MTKKIKNIDTVSHIWAGQTIDAGVTYSTANDNEAMVFGNNSTFLTDLAASKAQVYDDALLISDLSKAIDFLRGDNPKDSDGSPMLRQKITSTGWHYQLHCIEFSTSKLAETYSKNEAGNNIGFCTMKAYDASDVEITAAENLVNAVRTVFTWEPTHDYEIVGAMFYQHTRPTTNVRMWTTGVPDISEAYGGSKAFATGGVNLKFIPIENALRVDGRAPKYLTYSSTNHTNKLRLTFRHDAGVAHEMLLVFEIFKA